MIEKDPFNLVVAGVGGQGNVLASQLIAAILVADGHKVTVGETYGASQRGGSVMSHVRVSRTRQYGPLIPPRRAHLVLALEPSEAARILGQFGNPETLTVVNSRPVYPVDVISGDMTYPDEAELFGLIRRLSRAALFINATEKALELGNPILSNIILMGAAASAEFLPLAEAGLTNAILERMPASRLDINLRAFAIGQELGRVALSEASQETGST
jgi:indolepyruvate ferredoxin oxidoreductase, beta subunit